MAQQFGIPLESARVFIAGTPTDIVPNATPTAGSASSDMYGGAIWDACKQLKERLQPYREKLPDGTFKANPASANYSS